AAGRAVTVAISLPPRRRAGSPPRLSMNRRAPHGVSARRAGLCTRNSTPLRGWGSPLARRTGRPLSSRPHPGSLGGVPVEERFWTHRLRWRLRGNSWLWPAFGVAVLIDAAILHFLPPVGTEQQVNAPVALNLFGDLIVAG